MLELNGLIILLFIMIILPCIISPGKGQSWEGGIRVPTVAVWKDRIPAGITINEPTNSMDIFTTMIELAGGAVPRDRTVDGKNIFPLLMQEQSISPHDFMFHYCGSAIHAIRYRPRSGNITWKAHFVTPVWAPGKEICDRTVIICECFAGHVTHHDPPLLYDVTHDPYERNKLDSSLEVHQNVILKMKQAMKNHQQEMRPVPKQLGYPNAWPNPRLQPCCNFPYCSCIEE
jgi:arylsulfatase A-like enzyme